MKFDLRIQTTQNIIIGTFFMISMIHKHEYASRKISLCKVEKILKGSLDSIPSPLPSVKIQIIGVKVCLR